MEMKIMAEMLLLPPFCGGSISVFNRSTSGDQKDQMVPDPNWETPETTSRDLGKFIHLRTKTKTLQTLNTVTLQQGDV